MWFKNLCLYRLRSPWTLSAADFEEVLRTSPLNPVSGLSWTSEGWVSPRGDAQLVFAQEKQLLFAMGAEKKLLPSTVIRDVTAERARTFEQVKGFAPSRKQVRDLKEQVTNELLPRAFGQRGLHVHHGGQFLDIEVDRLGGIAGLFLGLGDDGGDGVADMAHLAFGQNRVPGLLHRLAMAVGDLPAAGQPADTLEILAGEDADHPGHGFGGGSVDPFDTAMRHLTAQEIHMRLTAQVDVIGIAAIAGEKADILAARGGGADAPVAGASILGHVILPEN